MAFLDDGAAAIGLATYDDDHRLLDAWFPSPVLGLTPVDVDLASGSAGYQLGGSVTDEIRQVRVEQLETVVGSLARAPRDAADAWLRLQLLSHRVIQPHQANLDGIFGLLTNVAWTSLGPVSADRVEAVRLRARVAAVRLEVYGVDKFPRMTDYVVPSGVRIADADRVRLGAYLSPGTTVMHEGFVNFNAGTLGSSMVEGRISAGVVVGDGTDIGGGASIIGTLSGGGSIVVSLGERCLLGANAGVGIPLGDDCIVEAGCYITAGTKVTLPDGDVVAARSMAGVSGMLFWRNSVTGTIEARSRSGSWGGLNAMLHAQ